MPLTNIYAWVPFYTIMKCYGKAVLMERKSASIFHNFGGNKKNLKKLSQNCFKLFFRVTKLKKYVHTSILKGQSDMPFV